MWCMWLVLPFWQNVQGRIKGKRRRSAFLWADEVVGENRKKESKDVKEVKREGRKEMKREDKGDGEDKDRVSIELRMRKKKKKRPCSWSGSESGSGRATGREG